MIDFELYNSANAISWFLKSKGRRNPRVPKAKERIGGAMVLEKRDTPRRMVPSPPRETIRSVLLTISEIGPVWMGIGSFADGEALPDNVEGTREGYFVLRVVWLREFSSSATSGTTMTLTEG